MRRLSLSIFSFIIIFNNIFFNSANAASKISLSKAISILDKANSTTISKYSLSSYSYKELVYDNNGSLVKSNEIILDSKSNMAIYYNLDESYYFYPNIISKITDNTLQPFERKLANSLGLDLEAKYTTLSLNYNDANYTKEMVKLEAKNLSDDYYEVANLAELPGKNFLIYYDKKGKVESLNIKYKDLLGEKSRDLLVTINNGVITFVKEKFEEGSSRIYSIKFDKKLIIKKPNPPFLDIEKVYTYSGYSFAWAEDSALSLNDRIEKISLEIAKKDGRSSFNDEDLENAIKNFKVLPFQGGYEHEVRYFDEYFYFCSVLIDNSLISKLGRCELYGLDRLNIG